MKSGLICFVFIVWTARGYLSLPTPDAAIKTLLQRATRDAPAIYDSPPPALSSSSYAKAPIPSPAIVEPLSGHVAAFDLIRSMKPQTPSTANSHPSTPSKSDHATPPIVHRPAGQPKPKGRAPRIPAKLEKPPKFPQPPPRPPSPSHQHAPGIPSREQISSTHEQSPSSTPAPGPMLFKLPQPAGQVEVSQGHEEAQGHTTSPEESRFGVVSIGIKGFVRPARPTATLPANPSGAILSKAPGGITKAGEDLIATRVGISTGPASIGVHSGLKPSIITSTSGLSVGVHHGVDSGIVPVPVHSDIETSHLATEARAGVTANAAALSGAPVNSSPGGPIKRSVEDSAGGSAGIDGAGGLVGGGGEARAGTSVNGNGGLILAPAAASKSVEVAAQVGGGGSIVAGAQGRVGVSSGAGVSVNAGGSVGQGVNVDAGGSIVAGLGVGGPIAADARINVGVKVGADVPPLGGSAPIGARAGLGAGVGGQADVVAGLGPLQVQAGIATEGSPDAVGIGAELGPLAISVGAGPLGISVGLRVPGISSGLGINAII